MNPSARSSPAAPLLERLAGTSACVGRIELRLLRCALALVFLWFGLPKLAPGSSPAEQLVCATIPFCDPAWFVPTLGAVEVLIGVCLLSRRLLTVGLVLMGGHMLGTVLPLFTLPDITWKAFPVPTLEGQYVLKNVVLVAAAIAVARAHLARPGTQDEAPSTEQRSR